MAGKVGLTDIGNKFKSVRELPTKDQIHSVVKDNSIDAVLSLLDGLSGDDKLNHEECNHMLTCLSELFFLKSGKTEEDRDSTEVSLPEVLVSGMESFKEGKLALGLKQFREGRELLDLGRDGCMQLSLCYSHAIHAVTRSLVERLEEVVTVTSRKTNKVATVGTWVVADAPARIDMAGGWSDTPPICYEREGKVVGVAVQVDGKRPISCRARRVESLRIILTSKSPSGSSQDVVVSDSNASMLLSLDPRQQGALLMACIVVSGLVTKNDLLRKRPLSDILKQNLDGGIELVTQSLLPEGSGMGTSSILAGCLLAAIWTVMGCEFSESDLVHKVLLAEQYLSTGGGWQDNVNGLCKGGFKVGQSGTGDAKVSFHVVESKAEFRENFEKRVWLLLPKQDVTRLAKPILRNVIRKWYFRDVSIRQVMQENFDLALNCEEAIKRDDINGFGEILTKYWKCKTFLSEGANPEPEIYRLIGRKLMPHLSGYSLAGAGGGGFMVVVLKSGRACLKNLVSDMVAEDQRLDCDVFPVKIDYDGIKVC